MGAQSFEQLKNKGKLSNNSSYNRLVKCLSYDLLVAAGQDPNSWEVQVFEDNSPNAFALPGNKIGVHTGMIKTAQNPHQLAAVIGHEIGHVLAEHGNERVSQNMVAQGGLMAASIMLGEPSNKNRLLIGALGLGAQFGVLMPFSRKHETEADRLGVQYMAKAGYNPSEAAQLWVIMGQGGGSVPEFLSTHPSPSSRVKDLEGYSQNYMTTYNNNKAKARCF
jgi:predicted Zn-dependent protease